MLSRSQAFAAAFSAKKALLNVNATVNAKRTFTFTSAMMRRRDRAQFEVFLRVNREKDGSFEFVSLALHQL